MFSVFVAIRCFRHVRPSVIEDDQRAFLTGALLDRLTHHVHILEMNGESFRLAHSKKRHADKPVSPPAAPQPE